MDLKTEGKSASTREASAARLDRGLVRGLAWSGTARWTGQLLTWLSTLAIARLLTPGDYGIVGIAVVFSGMIDLLVDGGLGAAVVQAREVERRDAERAMGAAVLLGLAGGALVVAAAPVAALMFGDERIGPILAALAITVVMTAIASVPNGLLMRRLDFSAQAKAQLYQGMATTLVTLLLAATVRSYWALVGGMVAGKAVYALETIRCAPVRPRFPGRDARVRALVGYGLVLMGDRILYYVRANFDIALVAARLGQSALGIYLMATTLARMPIDKLSAVIAPVAFPIFARGQQEVVAVRRHYLAIVSGTMFVLLPASAGLALTASSLLPVVIGPQWSEAARTLSIIALFTPVVFLWSLNHALLTGLGRARLNLKLTLAMTVLIPPFMLAGARWGVSGVALGGSLAHLCLSAIGIALTWRMLGINWRDFLRPLRPAVSGTIAMAAGVSALGLMPGPGGSEALTLVIQIILGAGIYAGWCHTWHRSQIASGVSSIRAAWRGGEGLETEPASS